MCSRWVQNSLVGTFQDQTNLHVGYKEIQWKEINVFLPPLLLRPLGSCDTVKSFHLISVERVDLPSLRECFELLSSAFLSFLSLLNFSDKERESQ